MKKLIILTLFCTVLMVTGCTKQKTVVNNVKQEIIPQAQILDENRKGEVIEDETDSWQYYENKEAGFSLNFPPDIILGAHNIDQAGEKYYLSIEVAGIDSLEAPMGYDQETALENSASLQNGEYGKVVDFPVEDSKKLRDLGGVNAQEFTVLARFEICDVAFEKKLYFFNNGHQVLITLYGPEETFAKTLSGYLIIDENMCGNFNIWDFDNDRLEYFYKHLEGGKLSSNIQRWHYVFDDIVNTIKFYDENNELDNYSALQGSWVSIDDADSIVEFKGNKKIDYYAEQIMSESNFDIYNDQEANKSDAQDNNGKYLIVDTDNGKMVYEIFEANNNSLTLNYLERGNTLKYRRMFEQ